MVGRRHRIAGFCSIHPASNFSALLLPASADLKRSAHCPPDSVSKGLFFFFCAPPVSLTQLIPRKACQFALLLPKKSFVGECRNSQLFRTCTILDGSLFPVEETAGRWRLLVLHSRNSSSQSALGPRLAELSCFQDRASDLSAHSSRPKSQVSGYKSCDR